VQDLMFFGIIIFVLAIIIVVGSKLNVDINDNYQSTDASTVSKEISDDMAARYNPISNWIFFSVFIIFFLAIMASVFLLNTHPALFFVVIVVLAFILIVLAIIGNAFDKFQADDDMGAEVAKMSTLDAVMSNWVYIMVFLGFMLVVVLFAKLRGGGR